MQWTTYDKASLWFTYEYGAPYEAIIKQCRRKIGAINNQLAYSHIRLYAQEKRAFHKRQRLCLNVTMLRRRMHAQGLPITAPQKPFCIKKINHIMQRQAPWTLPRQHLEDLIRAQKPKPLFEHTFTFREFCHEIKKHGFHAEPDRHHPGFCIFYTEKDTKKSTAQYLSNSFVVYKVNTWCEENKNPLFKVCNESS